MAVTFFLMRYWPN